MSSEKPEIDVIEEEPPPPPPEPEPEPVKPQAKEGLGDEDAWDEEYDEHIDGDEIPPPKPKKKKRGYGGIIVIVTIIIILVLWTAFSPKMLHSVGPTYLENRSDLLGTYVGVRDIWSGNTTWRVLFLGEDTADVGGDFSITVMVTKASEKPGNWFFTGSAVSLKNVSFYDEFGNFMGEMSNSTNADDGPVANVPIDFETNGTYYLYAVVKFLVTMDMRIGFLPLETVEIPQAYLDVPIIVS